MKVTISISLMISILFACQSQPKTEKTSLKKSTAMNENQKKGNPYYSRTDTTPLRLSEAEWRKVLPEDVFEIARHKDTERPFTGKYWNTSGLGMYYCAACGNALFRSDSKFSSSCGWPSFFKELRKTSVSYHEDISYGMKRVEVTCGRCQGHLGHIFDDGPPPTGKRFCMNSVVLDFEPDGKLLGDY